MRGQLEAAEAAAAEAKAHEVEVAHAMEREMGVRQSAQEEELARVRTQLAQAEAAVAQLRGVVDFHSDTDGVSDAMVAMRAELVEMRSAHLASTQLYAWSHLFGGVSDSLGGVLAAVHSLGAIC